MTEQFLVAIDDPSVIPLFVLSKHLLENGIALQRFSSSCLNPIFWLVSGWSHGVRHRRLRSFVILR